MTHRAAVVTCADEACADGGEDRSGPILRDGLAELGYDVTATVVPDDAEAIASAVTAAIESGARVVLTTGGTGVGPRDVTIEAVRPFLVQELAGIAERVRARGCESTPRATVSRELAGIARAADRPPAFLFTAPGSRGGARDTLAVLAPILDYLVAQLDGIDLPC